MNQTLLAALGQSFTSDNNLTPLSEAGGVVAHATTGECYGCHKSLDPMRMFFGNQYDFNDRNDFVANPFNGSQPNPRPTGALQAGFAFADVNWPRPRGHSLPTSDRSCCRRRIRTRPTRGPAAVRALGRAAALLLGELQRLLPQRPGLPRHRGRLREGSYNFPSLVKELLSSAL